MLASQYKISSQEFKKFYPLSKKRNSQHFTFAFIKGDNKKNTKFAVIVSKKVLKTAVLRNKNKRRIYTILRQHYPQFSSIDYGFFIVKSDISQLPYKEITQEILSFLK